MIKLGSFKKSAIVQFTIVLLLFFFFSQNIFSQTKKEWIQIGNRTEKEVLVKVLESDMNRTIVEFQIGGYFIERLMINDMLHIKISLPGTTPLLDKGFPDIPKVRENIIIPDSARMSFKILQMQDTLISTIQIAPSKGNLSRSINPDSIPYIYDSFYKQDLWYPNMNFTLGDPFLIKDFRGITLQYNPIQYNPVRKIIKVVTKIVVEITTIGSDDRNIKERKRGPSKISSDLIKLYKRQFINFNFLSERYTPVQESGRLLVVVYDSFIADVENFVNWKIQKGIPTITARYPTDTGNSASSLKNYIQGLYDSAEGLNYIILVGDNGQIPTMNGDHAQAAPSDPMYVKLEGNDNYPDAFISRISATSSAEVLNQLTKFINYERFPDSGTAATWYNRGSGIASNEGTPKDWERADDLRNKLITYGYTLIDQIYDPGASDNDITNAINDGRSIINYIGHGGDTNWSTTGFNNADIDALNNNNDLPFILDVACMNGNFTLATGDCFAERWLKAGTASSPRGAIGIYASSRNADWVPPCVMQEEAIDLLVTEQTATLGGICFNGVMAALDAYPGGTGQKLMEQFNLFGDCTMEIRTKTPRTFNVVHASSAPRINNNYVVAVKEGFTMIPNAKVTLVKDGQIIGSELTADTYPDKGTTKFSYNLPTGQMSICVTKSDYIPYIGTCQLNWWSGELWVSLHGGATKPFDEWYENTFCFNSIVNFEYHYKLHWAFVLEMAYNDFKWPDLNKHFPWWNISVTYRYYYPLSKFKPFINAGPGLYIPDEGINRLGVKMGLGLDYPITDRINFEIGSDFHYITEGKKEILNQNKKTSFQHFHTGFTFKIR
jgi:gingipain R